MEVNEGLEALRILVIEGGKRSIEKAMKKEIVEAAIHDILALRSDTSSPASVPATSADSARSRATAELAAAAAAGSAGVAAAAAAGAGLRAAGERKEKKNERERQQRKETNDALEELARLLNLDASKGGEKTAVLKAAAEELTRLRAAEAMTALR